MKKVNLFVYGTLMPNGHNDHWGMHSDADEVHEAMAFGEMFNRDGPTPVYPCVDFDGLNQITGVVMMGLDPQHEGLLAAHRMEEGAGYKKRTIKVTFADGREVEAIAYHYDVDNSHVGVRIDSGSWTQFVDEHHSRPGRVVR